jgi:hypothetical protein
MLRRNRLFPCKYCLIINNDECHFHKNNIKYCEYCYEKDCEGPSFCIYKRNDTNYINNFIVKLEHIDGTDELPMEYINAKIRQINFEKRIYLIKETEGLIGTNYIIKFKDIIKNDNF